MKKRINTKRVIIAILCVIGITCIILWFLKKNKPVVVENTKDNISSYGYSIPDDATDYYKSLYKDLQNNLNSAKPKEEDYARSVAKLFLTDFFTLNNKKTKSDIGGVQFVYASYQDDFMKYAKESVYDIIASNIDGNRKQELPIVKDVEIDKLSNSKYSYNKITDNKAYNITAKITYETNLGYQTSVNLIIIHTDSKLEIVSME